MSAQPGAVRTSHPFTRTALGAVALLGTLAAAPPAPASAADRGVRHADVVHVTDLGTLGGSRSEVDAVSADGRYAAGRSTTADGALHVFVWHRGRMTDLGTDGFATGVDLRGRVVGVARDPVTSDPVRGFLWQRGALTWLPTLGGESALPVHITPLGLIVGSATTADGTSHAVTWFGRPVRVHDLGLLGRGAVDARCGRIVGTTFADDWHGAVQPFVWTFGQVRRIPLVDGATSMPAATINCRGDVAGYVEDGGDTVRGFLHRRGVTEVFDLGGPDALIVGLDSRGSVFFNGAGAFESELRSAFVHRAGRNIPLSGPGGGIAQVNDVTNHGFAVGWAALPPDASGGVALGAVTWWHDQVSVLPDLGGHFGQATHVAENGIVFGIASTPDGDWHAVRWTAP